jgi:hypothetical protein
MSQTAVGSAAGISQIRVSRIETGKFVPSEQEIRALCRVYRAPANVRAQLVQAAQDLRAETASAKVILSRGAWRLQQRVARVERGAAEVRVYQPALIPGLLQTPDYARAVFGDGGDITGDDLDQAVEERITRQRVLSEAGRRFTFVLAEGALRWQASSPQVMAAQLDHLAESASRRVRIGVIPWTQPAKVFTTHGFSLYDRRTVIVGTRNATAFITDPRDVTDYVKLFDTLETLAVFGTAAQHVISATAAGYRTLTS